MKKSDAEVIKLNNAIYNAIGWTDYCEDYLKAWKLFNCNASLSHYVTDIVYGLNVHVIAQGLQEHMMPLLDSNNYKPMILALMDLIRHDNTIDSETIVFHDSVTNKDIKKSELNNINSIQLADFIAGVFVLAVHLGNNKQGSAYVKQIKGDYIEKFRKDQYDFIIVNGEIDHLEQPGQTMTYHKPLLASAASEKRMALGAALAIGFAGQTVALLVADNQMGLRWNITALIITLLVSFGVAFIHFSAARRLISSKAIPVLFAAITLAPVAINRLTFNQDTIVAKHLIPNALGFLASYAFLRLFIAREDSYFRLERRSLVYVVATTLCAQLALLTIVLFNQHEHIYQFFNNIFLFMTTAWCLYQAVSWAANTSYLIRINQKLQLSHKEMTLFLLLIPFFVICGLHPDNAFVFSIFLVATPMVIILTSIIWLIGYKLSFRNKSTIIIYLLLSVAGYLYVLWRNDVIAQHTVPILACSLLVMSMFISRTSDPAIHFNDAFEDFYWLMLSNNKIIDRYGFLSLLKDVPQNDEDCYYTDVLWDTLKSTNHKPFEFNQTLEEYNFTSYREMAEYSNAARVELQTKLNIARNMVNMGEPIEKIEQVSQLSESIIKSACL